MKTLNSYFKKIDVTESWRNSHVELSPEENRLLTDSPALSVRSEQMGNKSRAYYRMQARIPIRTQNLINEDSCLRCILN